MEVLTLKITSDKDQLLSFTYEAEAPDVSSAEGRRAFMAGTIEGLKRLKEKSDECLTGIIDKAKAETALLAQGSEPSKRPRVDE